ncbi:hypothetical protein [Streptomyces sp. AC627_RSS907]|uniref:hypothetical protein n=1 Tax=Streptomyces sp. AC627_RSS907 TaxID=2823684 RepID=UPI001C225DB5|nr:hypothetical protein [Streptomyces sp. AC627_RSS907]
MGDSRLRVTSHPVTDYLYDVVRHWPGAVPADPTWRERQHELGRVDVSFRHHRPAKAMQFRADVWQGWTVGNQLTAPAQGRRTDWVSSGAVWVDDAAIRGETAQHSVDVLRYPAGRTAEVRWFGPVMRPRMGPLGHQPVRHLDTFYVPAPGWGDSGAGHVGDAYGNQDVKNTLTLHQGDKLLRSSNTEYLQVSELDTRPLPYRLVVDNDRGTWAGPYSVRTLTEWDFTSAADGEPRSLPLIQLDYGVDTDLSGRAKRRTALTVTASHLPGTTAPVARPAVEVSYDDGVTWRRVGTERHGDGWRTVLHAPPGAGHVSLRSTARDGDGNSVRQTIIRAFGLR